MTAGEYVRGQHCDTELMLSTRQRFAHGLTAAQLLRFDRLWRPITQAVKK